MATSPLDHLTPRQRELLALVATGQANQAIATALGISIKTVENQLGVIYRQLGLDGPGAHTRVQAALAYYAATTGARGRAPFDEAHLVEGLAQAFPGIAPALRLVAQQLVGPRGPDRAPGG